MTFSHGVDRNYRIKEEDLTRCEIKTDGVPGTLAAARTRKTRRTVNVYPFPLIFAYSQRDRCIIAKINRIYVAFAGKRFAELFAAAMRAGITNSPRQSY